MPLASEQQGGDRLAALVVSLSTATADGKCGWFANASTGRMQYLKPHAEQSKVSAEVIGYVAIIVAELAPSKGPTPFGDAVGC